MPPQQPPGRRHGCRSEGRGVRLQQLAGGGLMHYHLLSLIAF